MSDLLTPDTVFADLPGTSKKQILQELAKLAARKTGLAERDIFDVLMAREQLGTTGVGLGVAIPHGKFKDLKRIYGFFARLRKPVDFDAVDDQKVDLMFLLLVPEDAGAEHLKALARVSRLLRNEAVCEKLRGSDGRDSLIALLTDAIISRAA